jgi:prevent-host-death family protein
MIDVENQISLEGSVRTVTATEAARNFSRVLDMLEHGTEEIIVVRNNHPVAKLVPGAPRMTALEALADLYRTLPDREGAAWLKASRKMDRRLRRQIRDPWP